MSNQNNPPHHHQPIILQDTTTVMWSSGKRCAAQMALFPVGSDKIWKAQACEKPALPKTTQKIGHVVKISSLEKLFLVFFLYFFISDNLCLIFQQTLGFQTPCAEVIGP